MTNTELIDSIVDEIFTTMVTGEIITRIQLKSDRGDGTERDCGGWGKKPLREYLVEKFAKEPA